VRDARGLEGLRCETPGAGEGGAHGDVQHDARAELGAQRERLLADLQQPRAVLVPAQALVDGQACRAAGARRRQPLCQLGCAVASLRARAAVQSGLTSAPPNSADNCTRAGRCARRSGLHASAPSKAARKPVRQNKALSLKNHEVMRGAPGMKLSRPSYSVSAAQTTSGGAPMSTPANRQRPLLGAVSTSTATALRTATAAQPARAGARQALGNLAQGSACCWGASSTSSTAASCAATATQSAAKGASCSVRAGRAGSFDPDRH